MKKLLVVMTILVLAMTGMMTACSSAEEGPTKLELQARIGELEGRIEQLNSSIDVLTDNVSPSMATDTSLEQRVGSLEAKVDILWEGVKLIWREHGQYSWPHWTGFVGSE